MIKINRVYQPIQFRIWHWLSGLTVLGLLGTVFLRKTFLSWRENTLHIQKVFQDQGVTLDADLADKAAKVIRNEMWEWHIILGYVLSGLLVFRFLFGKKHLPRPRAGIVQALYLIFYTVLCFMAFSGLSMVFGTKVGMSEGFLDELQEIHEVAMWFFVGFIPLHIAGVVLADRGEHAGLVSDMINGGKKE